MKETKTKRMTVVFFVNRMRERETKRSETEIILSKTRTNCNLQLFGPPITI